MRVLLMSFVLVFSGCANKLLRQSPPRAKSERFYKLDEKKGIIFHQRCEDLRDPRVCPRTYINLLEEWDFFRGEFILIPKKQVFK